jgi:hypothetical protein
MRRLCCSIILAAAMLGALSVPLQANAADGVLLGYGATYTLEGAQRTHRGVDLAVAAGDAATSLVAGVVSFCGRVPADDGGSVLAVTVRTADGMLVTVHPLAECWVSLNAAVSMGDDLGMVADTGDGSTAGAHLHLSARRGDAYLDPSFLLVEIAEPQPQPVTVPVAQSASSVDQSPGSGAAAAAVAVQPAVAAESPSVEAVVPVSAPAGEVPAVSTVSAVAPIAIDDPSPTAARPDYRSVDVSWMTRAFESSAAGRGVLAASGVALAALAGSLVRRRILVAGEAG